MSICTRVVVIMASLIAVMYAQPEDSSQKNGCDSNPCQNSGTCFPLDSGYVCICPSGYSGTYCEQELTEVETLKSEIRELQSRINFLTNATSDVYTNLSTTIAGVRSELYEHSSTLHGPRFFSELKQIEENETILVKNFAINSRQFLVVVHAHGLSIYEFNAATLSLVQTIPLTGTTSFEFFTLNSKHYIAVSSSVVYSKVYEWDSASSRFSEKEELDTAHAQDVEFIAIPNSGKFLVFSCSGAPSLVYLWSSSRDSFVYYQSLMTRRALKVHSIVTRSSHDTLLTIAESGNFSSHVYRWNRTSFDPYQTIDVHGAHELYPYVVGQETFVVAATKSDTSVLIHSTIKGKFIDFAPLAKALSVSYFSVNSEHFVAVAEGPQCGIYRMVGAKFEHFQSIASHIGASYVHAFSLQSGCQVLAVVDRLGSITLYKWTSFSSSSNDHCSS